MDTKNFLTPFQIRKLNRNSSVESARAKKRRIQRIRTVGCCQNYNTLGAVKTIHLRQKLIQCLLPLIVAAGKSGTVTFLSNGINLIDEDNTGSLFICLFKQITNLCRTHTYKHFHELRTGNGEERNFRFTGYGFCKQCFTCSGRADKKGTLRHGCTDLRIFPGIVQIVYDFCQKLFCLVFSCHICKLDSGGGFHIHLGAALAKGHHSAASAHGRRHFLAEPPSQENKDRNWNEIAQQQT